jgi:membrane protein
VRRPTLPGAVVDFGAQSLRRFVEIEGTQQATVLGAQAFTSLIPFLVVGSAFGPDESDIADRINDRFDIHGNAARSVEALFNSAGEVESAVTWVSVVILVLSATSFTRALQKMFQRAYRMEMTGWRDGWRGLAWLAFFGVWITISSPVRGALEDVGGLVFAIALSTVLGFLLWLCTPRVLFGPIDWRRFAPGAIVSAVLGALLTVASGIYVPILLTWSADKYGLIGVAFSIQSWLLATAFVVVIGAVVGAVTSELFGDRLTQIGRRNAVRG